MLIESILSSISTLANDQLLKLVLVLVASATISMIVIQILKELTPLRSRYQRFWFRRWLDQGPVFVDCAEAAASRQREERNATAIMEIGIIGLTSGGERNALYDLSATEMFSQMKLAVSIILDEPQRYAALLYRFSLGVSYADLGLLAAGSPVGANANIYFDTRARVTRRIDRNLSGADLALTSRWKFWMQLSSILLNTLIVCGIVASGPSGNELTVLLAIPVGILGGYLAPVANDILTAVQKLRG